MVRPVRSMYMDILENRTLDGDMYRVTIAANEKVRQPPEIEFGGLSTENYSRNPVVMWAHDAVGRSPSGGLPIGRTLSLNKTSDGRIVADFEFLSDDPFAQRVRNAWDKGFLRAASISWIPLESLPVSGGTWRDSRSDLREWSLVSIPADPEALRGGSSVSPTSTPVDKPAPLGESTPVVEPTPTAEGTAVVVDPTPASESTPVVVEPTAVVEATPAATEEPTPVEESTATATPEPKYTWGIMTVDELGSKPSLAIDSQGTPHVAYILEDMPGFVKHAVLEGGEWNISTISTGYFYGPLDIVVDDTGVAHISWHNHDEENEAYARLRLRQ